MSELSRPAIAGLVALACTGCFTVSGHFGAPIPVERVAAIEPGQTTREEITAWFGPPSGFYQPGLLDLLTGDGEAASAPVTEAVYSYRYVESRVRVLIVPFVALRARGTTQADTLTVFFDGDGRVRYHGYRRDAPGEELGASGP